LESVLQDNLEEFLGHQEVMNILFEKYPEKTDEYAGNTEKLIRLTTLLRGLVSEKVAITEIKLIVDYLENYPDVKNLTLMINRIRQLPEVNKSLPGNIQKIPSLKLSNEMEVEIQKSLQEENGYFMLAMAPETCQEVLTAVRNKVTQGPVKRIIVENDQLRPLVNQLLKLEFPSFPVLSQKEVAPGYQGGTKDYIEL
jgi:flagellar biosynthesis component FlhA